jgi:cytochrome c-type biogenesis protein CcmH/NrfG
MAVIHLRRAVAKKPQQLAYKIALTLAYAQVGHYDLAKQSYQETKQLAPHSVEVKQLREKLAALFRERGQTQ